MIQLFVGFKERFLNHIFGVLFVTSHAIGETEYRAAVALDEHTKGMGIASARLSDSSCIG